MTLGRYLLSIKSIPTVNSADSLPDSSNFHAYFVGSTAPNNVEDGVGVVEDPTDYIKQIAQQLYAKDNPELLIVVHGYNTALGEFDTKPAKRSGVKGWYQDIRDQIVAKKYTDRNKGLVMIGYRWPSEQVQGKKTDSFGAKFSNARNSLPIVLQVIVYLAIALLVSLCITAVTTNLRHSTGFTLAGISILILATIAISIVFTLFILRIVGYFRDGYRATNFGVPDLVELIRQLDKEVWTLEKQRDQQEKEQSQNLEAKDWKPPEVRVSNPIKLSFIAHSMGAFVVTNTVRILSDVFDERSIGALDMERDNTTDLPSSIGHAFSLGRLVLVSPDIPAETVIAGRSNFLNSSLRRFEETYLFSNEGDMALKLASTAANYASFPSRTREGGYRLGNVVVRSPTTPGAIASPSSQYGIVNIGLECELLNAQKRGNFYESTKVKVPVSGNDGQCTSIEVSSFLSYLFILNSTPLLERQVRLIDINQKSSVAELFTVFDCTDYQEEHTAREGDPVTKVSLLTRALNKPSLNFWDYIVLSFDFFTGKIDTHGGYFYSAYTSDNSEENQRSPKPDATFSKDLIYGLACLGFQKFVSQEQPVTSEKPSVTIALQNLSDRCKERGIQVLLSPKQYNALLKGE